MSYASNNPFALLDDDTPVVAPKAQKTPVVAPVAAAVPVKAAARAPRNNAPRDLPVNTEGGEEFKDSRSNNTASARGGARGGRGGLRGGRGGANPRSNGGTYLGGDRPRRENGGGRVFDKHSQTGHKDTDRSEAAGWGADEGKAEAAAEDAGIADAQKELDAATPAGTPGAATPVTDAAPRLRRDGTPYVPREEEEEDNTITYDEYMTAQAAAKLNLAALPAARQANEGADDDQWKDAVAVAKKGQNESDWFLGAQKAENIKAKKPKDTKTYIAIEANFKPPRREGGARDGPRDGAPRGDREGGAPRGGRGRGGARGGAAPRGAPRGAAAAPRAPRAAAVNVNDASSFPALA